MTVSPPPPRPPRWEEALGSRLFRALGPRLSREKIPATPGSLAPFEEVEIPRSHGPAVLTATWFPAPSPAAGGPAVLLLHPWLPWGRAYFHRHGRIERLREAGYSALTVDLPGFGGSGPPRGFYDLDVEDALTGLRDLAPGSPLFLWGVSSGGYWSHPVIARRSSVNEAPVESPEPKGAFFEDVSPHLLEWSWRASPWGRPFFLFFRFVLPRAYRFLDVRLHARSFSDVRTAYASGERDRGVRPEDTRALAGSSGSPHRIVPRADHLGSIKRAFPEVTDLALDTFAGSPSAESEGSTTPVDPLSRMKNRVETGRPVARQG